MLRARKSVATGFGNICVVCDNLCAAPAPIIGAQDRQIDGETRGLAEAIRRTRIETIRKAN
jgi:hypothetical protein